MTTEYNYEIDVEDTQTNSSNVEVEHHEPSVSPSYEDSTDDVEEQYFWSEPGICG